MYKGIRAVFTDETIDFNALTGPSGSVLANLWNAGKLGVDYVERGSFSATDTINTISKMGATLATSWNNADKAWFAAQMEGELRNKRGDKIAELTTPEIIWQALGISSVEALESGQVFKSNQEHRRFINKAIDSVMRNEEAARRAWLNNDAKTAEEAMLANAVLLEQLKPGDKAAVIRGAAERVNPNLTAIQEAIIRWDQDMQERSNRIIIER